MNDEGLVAGTLVHVPDGLRAIEDLRVGDPVMSFDPASGAPTFGRVLATRTHAARALWLVRILPADTAGAGWGIDTLGVAAGQRFLLGADDRRRVDDLDQGGPLMLRDGTGASILCAVRLLRTGQPAIAWARGAWGAEANDFSGNDVDFGVAPPEVTLAESSPEIDWDASDGAVFRASVYALDVTDGGYWVGRLGVRVADASRPPGATIDP